MKILEHKALNPNEIYKVANTPFKVVKYSDLYKFKNIEDMFNKKCKCVLMLYEQKNNYGHWVCLINHPKKVIFFDPYAMEPDDQLQFTNIKFRKDNNMELPYLTYLLFHSEKPIDYNDKRFQKLDDKINTCGYWVGIRMRKKNIDSDQFIKIFEGIPSNELDNEIIKICNKYI